MEPQIVAGLISAVPIVCAIFANGALQRRGVPVDIRALVVGLGAGGLAASLRGLFRKRSATPRPVPVWLFTLVWFALIVMTVIIITNIIDRS